MQNKKNKKIAAKMIGGFLSAAMWMASASGPVYANPIVEKVDIQVQEVQEEEAFQSIVEDISDEVQKEACREAQWDLNNQEELEKALRSGSVTLDRSASVSEECVGAFSRQNIVDIAKSQVGVSGRPNIYTRWLGTIGGSYSYAWCHAFASWCGAQAGGSKLVPITAGCWQGTEWFKEKGLWKSRGSGYTPKQGDFIYFDWGANGGWDHVGIVNYVSDGRVYTIEGNTSDMVKASKSYALSDVQIIGYGTPQYSGTQSDGNLPKGCFDEISSKNGMLQVAGWAFDWDDPSHQLDILVSVGGELDTGASVYKIKANAARPDVAAAFPGCGNDHGFDSVIDVEETGKQSVYIYAVNIGKNSEKTVHQLIGSKEVVLEKEGEEEEVNGEEEDNEQSPQETPVPITVERIKNVQSQRVSYNKLNVSWESISEADAYELQVSSDKMFEKNVETFQPKDSSKTVTVKTGTPYYFRVRANRTENGRVYYGDYSKVTHARAMLEQTKITSYKCTPRKKVTLWYKKVKGASGYQIVFSPQSDFSSGKQWYHSGGTGKLTNRLKSGRTYYFMVRAYRMVDGKQVYGPFSEVKKVTIKK